MSSEDTPRRFLLATAVTRYLNEPSWDRPELVQARERVIGLFTGRLGYRHITSLALDPTSAQLTAQLRAFCTSPERRVDDLVVVYIGGHGEVLDEDVGGGHVLLTSETDPHDIADALPTETLARKMLAGTDVRRLLLLLDTCYSGQGGNELAAAALERMGRQWGTRPGSGFAIVSSAQPAEQADTGAFPRLLDEAVDSLATAGHGPQNLALDSVVQRMNDHPGRPGHQRIGLVQLGLTGQAPDFLPNPRHDPALNEVDLAVQQDAQWRQHAERREVELRTRLLVRAMGSADGSGWWFCGRRQALADVTAWLVDQPCSQPTRPVMAVTAGPGSGKTALLGLITALSHPERRRTVPLAALGFDRHGLPPLHAIDVAIYAQNLTDRQVFEGIAAAARAPATTIGELVDALTDRTTAGGRPLTVLIDALDEAASPTTLCTSVIRPLIDHAQGRVRLLLGTRPHLLHHLGLHREQEIDLDADHYADPDALLAYTVRTLVQAHHGSRYLTCAPSLRQAIATHIATAAGKSFLVARITAGTLAASRDLPDPADPDWRAALPSVPGEAMAHDLNERLREDAARAADLLRPLAYAQGQGLPWEDLWAPLASAIARRTYTDDDVLWLRGAAGAYIVEATESDRSAYRLYHHALAEHLKKGLDETAVHAAFTETLVACVPYGADGSRDWGRAHPYTLRHLATHAYLSNRVDDLVDEAEYLVHADPDSIAPHLHSMQSDTARLASAVYRTSIGSHRHAPADARRQILALDAARHGNQPLLTALNSKASASSWKPVNAAGPTPSAALRNTMTGHTSVVWAVAYTELDGRPVAVTGSDDETLRVWDLRTGRPVGEPMTGHTGTVWEVACTVLDGRPVAVSVSSDTTVRVWDLTTRRPIGPPMTGHTGKVWEVACAVLDGRPVAVSVSSDTTVRVWDLTTRRPIGPPMTGHTDRVTAVACTVLDGRPVAVTGSDDKTVRVWDLTTKRPVGEPMKGHTDSVWAVACTELDGAPVAVTGSEDETLRVWHLATEHTMGQPLVGHALRVSAVVCTELDGRPVAITGSTDATVRVCALDLWGPVSDSVTSHTNRVRAVACAVLNERPVAVTGSYDTTVRVWDLATGRPVGEPLTGHTGGVRAVACTQLRRRPVAVSASDDGTVRLWDLTTGAALGAPLTGHTDCVTAVACTELDGHPVAVTASDDRAVRIWDLATGQSAGDPMIDYSGFVTAVACTELHGRVVAVAGTEQALIRIWDLATGQTVGRPITGHKSGILALACTELDGRAVAVTGSYDRTVRVWDLSSGTVIGNPLAGHTERVSAVMCAEMNERPIVISGSRDATVRIWDMTNGDCMEVLQVPASYPALATTDTGILVCTYGSDIATFSRAQQTNPGCT